MISEDDPGAGQRALTARPLDAARVNILGVGAINLVGSVQTIEGRVASGTSTFCNDRGAHQGHCTRGRTPGEILLTRGGNHDRRTRDQSVNTYPV